MSRTDTHEEKATESGSDKSDKIVLGIMLNLSKYLKKFRDDNDFVQDEAARRLGLSKVRYAEIERQSRIPADYGCSLGLLVKLALEQNISLSQLLAELQGHTSLAESGVDYTLIEHLKTLSPEKTLELVQFLGSSSSKIGNSFEWLVNVGLDLYRLPYKKRLEIEMDIHRAHVESAGADSEEKEKRRQEIYRLMGSLLETEKRDL
jgi:hypothetical protein